MAFLLRGCRIYGAIHLMRSCLDFRNLILTWTMPMSIMRLCPHAFQLFLVGMLIGLPSPVWPQNFSPALCQKPESCFSELLVELDHLDSDLANFVQARKVFRQLETAYGSTSWGARARLRYGHALRTVNPGEAIPLLQRSVEDFPPLADYLQYWEFQASVKAGMWTEASKIIREFTDRHGESLLRATAWNVHVWPDGQ